MKRRGSILIFALLIFVVVMMGALYVLHSSTLHVHIAKNNSVSNQGFYSAEKKIYMSLFEEKYYKNQLLPMLVKHCRGGSNAEDIVLDKEDLDYNDTKDKVKTSFEMKNNRKCIKLIGESGVNNQSIKVSSVYSIVEDIYELGLPIVHGDYINDAQQEDLNNILLEIERKINIDDLPRHMTGIDSLDYERIVVNSNYKNYLEFQYFRNNNMIKADKYFSSQDTKGKEFVVVINDKFHKDINFHIDSPSKKTSMRGILYIEDDLIIDSEFIFYGIIIINNGKIIVNSEIKPQINGIIISNGEEGWINSDRLIVNYDSFYIYRYGTYLPNFLDYKFVVMKKAK